MASDKLLPPREAAKMLGVDPKTLTRWAKDGTIPSVKLPSGHRRYRLSDINGIVDN